MNKVLIWSMLVFTQTRAGTILNTDCFYMDNTGVHVSTLGPCGIITPDTGFLMCCARGDFCLENGICSWNRPVIGNYSGFYIGGCTDASFNHFPCNTACSSRVSVTDAVYNSTTGLWNCCGTDTEGNVQCNAPTNETLKAPGLAALSSTFLVGNLIVSVPSATATASSTLSSILSSTPLSSNRTTTTASLATTTQPLASADLSQAPKNDGFSSGAKAGVGISSVVGALGIIGSLLVGFAQYRSRKKVNEAIVYPSVSQPHLFQPQTSELETTERPVELVSAKEISMIELP